MSELRHAKAVILAAGLGTRMKSEKPKVLHEVLGRPMVNWVVGKSLAAGCEEVAVVVGYAKEDVIATVNSAFDDARISFHEQKEMLGTGDAVRAASAAFDNYDGRVVILCGDVPNVPVELLHDMLDHTESNDSPVALISAIAEPGTHYGRIVRDANEDVRKIVEFKDADEDTRRIREVNTGNYVVDAAFLRDGLANLDTDNAQGEFYLTDLIAMASDADTPALGLIADDIDALHGVNTRKDLGHANEVALRHLRDVWMTEGVTMYHPSTVWLDSDVKLEADSLLESHVSLTNGTYVEKGAHIESFSRLDGCRVEAGVRVPAHTIATNETFSS
jgi:bifunctional UDP-N-acetylglucosamine pyrophosphorylase/glucosamine-1-phosphate N-acetyltransferase